MTTTPRQTAIIYGYAFLTCVWNVFAIAFLFARASLFLRAAVFIGAWLTNIVGHLLLGFTLSRWQMRGEQTCSSRNPIRS